MHDTWQLCPACAGTDEDCPLCRGSGIWESERVRETAHRCPECGAVMHVRDRDRATYCDPCGVVMYEDGPEG